jgi:hypothetical protein
MRDLARSKLLPKLFLTFPSDLHLIDLEFGTHSLEVSQGQQGNCARRYKQLDTPFLFIAGINRINSTGFDAARLNQILLTRLALACASPLQERRPA